MTIACSVCGDCFWVCENHPDRPWDGEGACDCGGAGMPCPKCNPADKRTPPKELAGWVTVWDSRNGWRH